MGCAVAFFLNVMDGTNDDLQRWRTMDIPTIQGLLNGTVNFLDPSLAEYSDIALKSEPAFQITPPLFFCSASGKCRHEGF